MGMLVLCCLGSYILLWATLASSILCSTHILVNTYTSQPALLHLIALELNCSEMEEKEMEGGEEHNLPSFLKKNYIVCVELFFLQLKKNVIPLSSGFHNFY